MRTSVVLTTVALAVGLLAPFNATAARPRITLAAPTSTYVATVFTLQGRVSGTGTANNKVIKLQEKLSGRWTTTSRLWNQDDGTYRFRRQKSKPGLYEFRTVVKRGRTRLDVSPRRSVTVLSSPPTPPGSGAECQSPTWTTSTPGATRTWQDPEGNGFPDGVGTYGQYMLDNNMWNADGYRVSQTVSACNYASWYAVTTADNSAGDGAVKTYPNVHVDYIDWGTRRMQPLSAYSAFDMRWAHKAPTTAGVWNVAFDVWLNGIGNGSANELMIWTENHNQVPAGVRTATVTIGGVEWAFWKGYNGHYLAFVPTGGRVLPAGELDLIEFTNWLASHGHLPTGSVLGQVDYGVEVVSTNGVPTRFDFTDFKITETVR